MKNWRDVALAPDTTVREAMLRIDANRTQFAMVVDIHDHLLGTVSDGDIRRGLLAGFALEDPIAKVMHRSPTVASVTESKPALLTRMHATNVRQMPLIDSNGKLRGLVLLGELSRAERKDNLVIVMAGGIGERLRPLTERVPKPMLHVGGRPILESILVHFREEGFCRFVFCVNYKAEMIEAWFGSGSTWGVEITYVREPKRLGTAGALRLIAERPVLPMIVINGDILTHLSICTLLTEHVQSDAFATMCVRQHEYQVPFGVIRTSGNEIVGVEEKPTASWLVNAGVYALDPRAIDLVPPDTFFDMPSLFESARTAGERTMAHTVRDFWIDVGRPSDFERANAEFARLSQDGEPQG